MSVNFDLSSSLARLGGDYDLFRTLVMFFQEDYPALLEQIREGVQQGDVVQVERASHNLHGLVGSFSADGVQDAIQGVSECTRQGKLQTAQYRLSELEVQVERLRDGLCSYVDGLGS